MIITFSFPFRKRICLNPYIPSGVEYKKVRKKERDRHCNDPGGGSPGDGSGGGGGNSGAGGSGGMGGAGGSGEGSSDGGAGGSRRERNIRIQDPTDAGPSKLTGSSLSLGEGPGDAWPTGDLRRSPVASRKGLVSDRKILTSAAGGQNRNTNKMDKNKTKTKVR